MKPSAELGPQAQAVLAAFRILEPLGESGRCVWLVARAISDLEARLAYLQRAIAHLRARMAEGAERYQAIPVDARTFVECPLLLNMAGEVYPKVLVEIEQLCSGAYVEAVLTGGVGTGKTTVALIATAYALYELSCLRSPHQEFGLAASSEIEFIFQSLRKELSRDVDYRRFKAMLDGSPYFQHVFRYDHAVESQLQFPKRVIVKPLTGATTAAIGQNVFGGVIDEMNFMAVIEGSRQSVDGGTFDQAKEVYQSIARRRQSRFMRHGRLPGMLCLVSSRQHPGEFTDRKIAEAKINPQIFVYDKRVWEVKPEGTFTGTTFLVFIGDATRKPRILEEDEEVAAADRDLVMAIPVEYRPAFEDDMLAALRDIAGVSTTALYPFILNTDAIGRAFGRVESIASRPDCDFQGTRLKLFPKRLANPAEPRFAHVDLGLTGDSCGVAVGHVERFIDLVRGEEIETLPVIRFDLLLEVRPPKNGEIDFESIRKLFYSLRAIGMPLKWATYDSWQSTDSLQLLAKQGFITGLQSMDRTSVAYDVSKQALYDDRVLAPAHAKAERELARLERDPKTRKIDHPPRGSKDVADAMAGVIYGLTMRRELWVRHGVPLTRIPKALRQPPGKKALAEDVAGQEQVAA